MSDLVVAFAPETLVRLEVERAIVLEQLEAHGLERARALVAGWPCRAGRLVPEFVDGVLLRSHLEMQRLSEEFQQGARMHRLLAPLVQPTARQLGRRPRVVDVGCGLGYVTRWLASAGELPVELVGCDYNRPLLEYAATLACQEALPCSFLVANAFTLDSPADIFTSTGVIHHFRGKGLARFFEGQAAASPAGFVHCDIKPSYLAPLGSWIFHRARTPSRRLSRCSR